MNNLATIKFAIQITTRSALTPTRAGAISGDTAPGRRRHELLKQQIGDAAERKRYRDYFWRRFGGRLRFYEAGVGASWAPRFSLNASGCDRVSRPFLRDCLMERSSLDYPGIPSRFR